MVKKLELFEEIMKKVRITSEEIEELLLEIYLKSDSPIEVSDFFASDKSNSEKDLIEIKIKIVEDIVNKYFLSIYYCWLIDKIKFTKLKNGIKQDKECLEDYEYGLDAEDNLTRIELLQLKGNFETMKINEIKNMNPKDRTTEMLNYKNLYEKLEKRSNDRKNLELQMLIENIREEYEKNCNIEESSLSKKYNIQTPKIIKMILEGLNSGKDNEELYSQLMKKTLNYKNNKIFSKKFDFDLNYFLVEDGYNLKAVKKIRKNKQISFKEFEEFKIKLINLYKNEANLSQIQAEAHIAKTLERVPYFLKDIPRDILNIISNYLKNQEIIDAFNSNLAYISLEEVETLLPKLQSELKTIEEIH